MQVILLSSKKDPEDLIKAIELNVVKYLIKPVQEDELKLTIEDYIKELSDANATKGEIIGLGDGVKGGDKSRFLELGFDSYLSKPIVHNEFLNVLDKHLKSTKTDDVKKVVVKAQSSIAAPEHMVNMEDIREALQLPDEILKKLLLKYVDTIDTIILNLRDTVEKGDFDEISSIAHSIKGSAGNLHFKQLQALALKMEKSAKLHEKIDYLIMVDSAEKIIFQIKQEITDILNNNEGDTRC